MICTRPAGDDRLLRQPDRSIPRAVGYPRGSAAVQLPTRHTFGFPWCPNLPKGTREVYFAGPIGACFGPPYSFERRGGGWVRIVAADGTRWLIANRDCSFHVCVTASARLGGSCAIFSLWASRWVPADDFQDSDGNFLLRRMGGAHATAALECPLWATKRVSRVPKWERRGRKRPQPLEPSVGHSIGNETRKGCAEMERTGAHATAAT